MLHVPPLVSTIAIGLVLAFAFGVLANRFKLPPLVGYLVAGIAIGPFTPGFVADQNIANQLAEVGVILLMFGVGLHFSLKDLLRFALSPCRGRWRRAWSPRRSAWRSAGALGWSAVGGAHLRRGAVGGEHRGSAQGVPGAAADRDRTRPHHRRLADRAGHRHGAGARAAAGTDGAVPRHGDGARRGRDRALDHHPARQVRHLHRRHAAVRQEADPGHPALRRPYRQPRAVPPGRAVDCLGCRLRRGGAVRHLAGAGRLLRRHDAERVAIEPAGRHRVAAVARRLRRAVLRLGRHAVRSGGASGGAAGAAGHRRSSS